MSLTAAASGLVVLLLSVQVVQGQSDGGVTYTSTQICAIKGSTVIIPCTYRYPSRMKDRNTTVEKSLWFTKMNGTVPVDLTADPEYSGRVQYNPANNLCTLRLTDLRESDSAEYMFMFITNQPDGRFIGSPGVTLSVSEPHLEMRVISHLHYATYLEDYIWEEPKLKCLSSCRLPDYPSFIFYKNGQKMSEATHSEETHAADSYSCALEGYEAFPSPPVCINDESCNRVTYTDRSVCAVRGSLVNISCTYNNNETITSKFWFRPEGRDQRKNPEDLREDSQYAGRVQIIETERGRSTLRIADLRESDSAAYHFKFKTQSFEWRSSLPGTNLTVTALQVQVTRITVQQSHTDAELKCHSSCSPAGHPSYVWFKNGEEMMGVETSSIKAQLYPADNISCAVKGHQEFPSPAVYAPKLPSVSVNPSAEIVEGSSVTLTCSSDANPAAKYTWYKENGNPDVISVSEEPQLVFSSIQSSDSGQYHCAAENELGRRASSHITINVKYAPKLPSVSVNPSAEIVEGSSVTLTCSSDANPAANYTWYKENEDSPKASGQIFTITDVRPEHSGNYYCEAENTRGRHYSALQLTVVADKLMMTMNILRLTLVVVMPTLLLLYSLWMRRQKTLSSTEPYEDIETVELESDPDYVNVSAVDTVSAGQRRHRGAARLGVKVM
ncbi:B-cell receptor CD22-like [Epinephelus fuscoguttatus]|uniref:B-cell receptor CD22-like n=1 Tax=Epinephelus fuscoguttatus TaxID=293821 RepID=UPI0020D0F019|nr:B-cell receptor CD22-like [Epinephelus fuscoguttatus]